MKKDKQHIMINPKYYSQHNFLIYCNDVLVRWLKWFDENQKNSISFQLKNEQQMHEFQTIADEDIMEWMKSNGYEKEMYELNRRHILCSLVADFCHYMFESFVCASKMKIAVAYALLRKPLRDNLAYIEWMRVNPNELINKLLYSEPEEYDLSKEKELKKRRIEQISQEYGIDRVNGMFEFRYEKNSDKSLEKIWNKANHIVTTQKYTRSEKGELNFVFVNMEQWDYMAGYYYTVVPLIMSYAVELILSMFEEIAEVNPFTHVINKTMQILHQARGAGEKYYQETKSNLELEKCPMICPHCGRRIELDKAVDKLIVDKYRCSGWRCRKRIFASDYIFDFEKIKNYTIEE